MAIHQSKLGIGRGCGEYRHTLAAVVGRVSEVHEPVVAASCIVNDLLAHHLRVPLNLAVEVVAELYRSERLQLPLPDGTKLDVGCLEMADVLHDLDPTALGVDGHEAVVAVAELLVRHGNGGAVGLEVFDGFERVWDDPADVVDGRVVFGKPLPLVFELIWRSLELHLEGSATREKRVVDATLAGVMHVVGAFPVVGGDGVVPLQPIPHGISWFRLVDAEVVQLVRGCAHAKSPVCVVDSIWVCTHNSHVARISEATKAENRRRLLDAAAAEFATRGLDGARVDDISLAAGLAKGTIYNYFDSKLDVFRAVIEEWARRSGEARESVGEDAHVRDQLRAIIVADMAAAKEMEEFARTAFREVISAPADVVEQLLPAWDSVDAEIKDVVTRAQARGELRSDRTPDELARIFATLVNGLMLEHWLPGSTVSLDDIAELSVDYYLDGAGA